MGDLRAGTGKIDITPPVGVELCGYGAFLGRRSTAVHDALYCRALVLDSGQDMLVLIENDLIGITADSTAAVRRALRQQFGVADDHVMIVGSHTHSGPNTVHLIGWGEPDPDYVRGLPDRIVAAVERAVAHLQPAHLGTGRGLLENVACNRVQSDGTGLVDPEMTVIRIDGRDGRSLSVVVHFSAHPVTLGAANTQISGDYAGAACRLLEKDFGENAVALFLNGACGDINVAEWAKGADQGFPLVEDYGYQVAHAATAIAEQVSLSPEPVLSARQNSVRLPLSVPDRVTIDVEAEAGIEGRTRSHLAVAHPRFYQQWHAELVDKLQQSGQSDMPVELQAFRIGDCVLAAQPSELFTHFGLLIKQRSPHRHTVVVGYANDFVGYVPRPQDYDDSGFGGYAARLAPKILGNFEFCPNVGTVLAGGMLDLLARL